MAPGRIRRIISANRKIISDYRQGAEAGGVRGGVAAAAGNFASSPLALLAQSVKQPTGLFWKGLTGNKSILGINIGIGSFLKQSMTFNTSVASILQIIGAIVDVAIAPFLIPLIVPLAKKMGSWVPAVSEYANNLAANLVPKITAMATSVWNGDGNWLSKSADIITGTLGILWSDSGLSEWWDKQTGAFGLFLSLIEGFGKFIRANYRLLEGSITVLAKFFTIRKDPFSVESAKIIGEGIFGALKLFQDPIDAFEYLFFDRDENMEASINAVPPAETLNKNMYDRMGVTQ